MANREDQQGGGYRQDQSGRRSGGERERDGRWADGPAEQRAFGGDRGPGGPYGGGDVSPAAQRSHIRDDQRYGDHGSTGETYRRGAADRNEQYGGVEPRYGRGEQGPAHDHDHEPHYRRWREQQLSNHDADYARWRDQQASRYDEDYRGWRSHRDEAFAQDFHSWREANGARQGGLFGSANSPTGPSGDKSGLSGASTGASGAEAGHSSSFSGASQSGGGATGAAGVTGGSSGVPDASGMGDVARSFHGGSGGGSGGGTASTGGSAMTETTTEPVQAVTDGHRDKDREDDHGAKH